MFVKICGVRDAETLSAAVEAGADAVGLVMAATSPRFVALERAELLVALADEAGITPWVVTVGASDEDFWRWRDWPAADLHIQLHGAEPPEQVAHARDLLLNRTVIKALPVAKRKDLNAAASYDAAHGLLLDAKPPKGADRAGGHGVAFNWAILEGWRAPKPWMLSGGLTPDNVAEAVRISGAQSVDVSSGVESAPGVKDPSKMRDFVQAAKEAAAEGV